MARLSKRPGAGDGAVDRTGVRRLFYGLIALAAVLCYGVTGYVLLGWTPFEAFYMVVITVSGVGFGEVHPLKTTIERVHTIGVITFGLVAVAFTVASLIALLTEGGIQRTLGYQRMRRRIDEMRDHAIIAGFGGIGSLVADELLAASYPFVAIERAPERIAELERREIPYVRGDATHEPVLLAAGIERAHALVAVMPHDADNVFVTLTARQLSATVRIISRAENPTTHKTLHQAGASHVILPAAIGARRIASLLTNPSAVEFAELVTNHKQISLEMDEVPIPAGSMLAGRSIAQADIRNRTEVVVVAVKRREGEMQFPASNTDPLEAGDVLVVLGRRTHIDQFRAEFAAKP